MMKLRDILIIISLFLVAFLIRAAGVSNVYMYGDEWIYLTKTNWILVSNWVPTTDVFGYSPPFLQHIGAVVTVLFNGELNTLRMISVIFGSLTTPFLYLFGKTMYDRRTGLLSAFLLCFSAFHCLYSRIYMLDVFTLFFITAFLYYFWRSQHSEQQKGITYACLAGAMMGLAITAKYISLFLVPAVLVYVLWTKGFNFKALVDKQIILTFIFAFLFFLPLLICLFYTGVGFQGMCFHIFERFGMGKETPYNIRALEFSPDELLINGMENMLGVLARGAQILIPTWADIFLVSVFLLFFITIFSYLPQLIKREKKGSFLLISFFSLHVILLGCARHQYYLMYSLPPYFVMLSHLAVKSFDHLRRENTYKNIFRIFIILLMGIILFSSFITGITSPYLDAGDYSGAKSAVDFIKNDIIKNNYEGHVVIGVVAVLKEVIDYPLHLSDLNASTICVLKSTKGEYVRERRTVDLESIDILKPNYLIVNEPDYKYYFKENIKSEIFKDYRIVFHSQASPLIKAYNHLLRSNQDFLVLKRKNMQPHELITSADGKDGEISYDIFKVPGVMKVGKVYTVLVQVKNTGDSRSNFTVVVHSDKYTLFIDEPYREITLDKDSVRILKFKIIPIKEYVGELPITVDLYAKHEENETYRKVDSSTDYVYLIKR